MMNNIECPYCECTFTDETYYETLDSDNKYDLECPHCEAIMNVQVEFEPSFSTSKIEYYDCVECGNNYRFTGNWYPTPSKYPDNKTHICDKCKNKLIVADYDIEKNLANI